MRKQFSAICLLMAATVIFSGCDKKSNQESSVSETITLTIETGSTTEVTTVGMEEISGVLNINGSSVGETSNTVNVNQQTGNSAGNLINSGIVCESGDKIYYLNKSDNKYLYVVNKDGSDKKAIGNIQGAMELNAMGDYIYYQAGGIYKVKISDSNVTTLVTEGCRNMVVTENKIFYIKAEGELSKIHSMNHDGSEDVILSDNIAGGLNVKDGYLYYINGSDSGCVYRMNFDGSEEVKLCDMKNVQELLVDSSLIYLVSGSNDGNHIYRLGLNGGEATEINSDSCYNINMNGGVLYYYNASDSTLCYSLGDGTNETILYSGQLNAINVISDWVYFFNTDDFQYYRITKDGNNIEIVD